MRQRERVLCFVKVVRRGLTRVRSELRVEALRKRRVWLGGARGLVRGFSDSVALSLMLLVGSHLPWFVCLCSTSYIRVRFVTAIKSVEYKGIKKTS